ncbi:MAG: hypothetical protein RLZZ479_1134 [Bacteroidota bacterium]|jgi:hypothetical protein
MNEKEFMDGDELQNKIEREAALFAQQNEQNEIDLNAKNQESQQEKPTSIGKAQKFLHIEDDTLLAAEIGWKNIPMESLPSKGLFYQDTTQVAIRAASVAEIRHWSTMDDNDLLSTDDMLNFIIEKCCRIKVPGKPGNYRDLLEIDRFYLIFAIRDFTFKNGENKLMINVTDNDGFEEKIEVTKDLLDYFNPDERLMNYYDSTEKCFKIRMKNGESFNLYLPTLGTMNFIKSYIKQKQQANKNFDKAFVKYAPFLFPEWKTLTQAAYDKAMQDSLTWSIQRISVLDKLIEILTSYINPQIKYISSGGGEKVSPLNFPGGFKSIFLISDIFGELV